MSTTEPRPITPLDLPLVHRLTANRLPLDTCAALTRGLPGLEEALLSAVPLTDLGAPTFVVRNGDSGMIGQFRHRAACRVAHLTFLAPDSAGSNPREWVSLLETMAFEAGKRGAHVLNAEVDQDHPIFQAFRLAGFAVYSRQVILRRAPRRVTHRQRGLLRSAQDRDAVAISTLQNNTVPRLIQQAEDPQPAPDYQGLVYEREGQIAAYLAVSEGKSGVVIKPYFHPEAYDQASTIILSALAHISRAEQVPVYLYARSYQDWLRGALDEVEFEAWTHQALLVKYTVVRVGRVQPVTLPDLETNRLVTPVADGPVPLLRRFSLLRWQKRRTKRLSPSVDRHNGKSITERRNGQ
ncbi:MAG: hypothetical protein K8S97_01390 [Anaerolineae bacterium]|nr:hypothetical protein [Anaerolineae bacterium]